ncbi:MAG TPA: hypothetical protein VLA96_04315, partial [Terriglobales bacterium]|nr:hypothetical protein [Terriglobales bacterium]
MFTVSLASLLLELALTRLFSVVLFYHFAFLAISIALLGLGAGGVFAYVRKQWLERWRTGPLAAALCCINAVAIVVVLEVVLHLPVSLELSKWNFLKLTVIYLVSAVPFFFTGVLFSVVFAREAKTIGVLYGADLIGGAMACLAVVPLLNLVGGPNTVVAAAIVMAVGGQIWATKRDGARHLANGLVTLLVILLALNYSGKLIDIKYAKGQRRDQPWMEWARWNAISRVEVNKQGTGKVIVIDADAQTAIMNTDPYSWDPVYRRDLMAAAPAVANVLRPTGDYAIIGPGGGVDVLRAVANGSRNVTGIEINPLIADRIMRGEYADYAHHLYEIPEVHIHVADGRSWIRNSHDKYDVIQMTLVDTWASTAAGAYALSENNLYTVEAFKEYFQHLKGDGFIAITRWEFKQPREALRVVSQGVKALQELGIKDPRKHFLLVSDGALDEDGRPVLVLVKRSPFTQEEEDAVRAHLERNPTLKPVYFPFETHDFKPSLHKFPPLAFAQGTYSNPPSGDNQFHRLLSTSASPMDYAVFLRFYPYNIRPVTDNAPFFFFTIKTKDVLKGIFGGTGKGMDWRINLGSVVLFMLLSISAAAVVGFLVVPLALHPASRLHGTRGLWYFVAVGLGYILVEIAFIQRFVLFLGHPTYALTVVVFLMLLSSGAGSIVARRWIGSEDPRRVRWALGAIVAAIALYLFVLPPMLTSLVGLDFGIKLALTALVLVPLGFAMGMPF